MSPVKHGSPWAASTRAPPTTTRPRYERSKHQNPLEPPRSFTAELEVLLPQDLDGSHALLHRLAGPVRRIRPLGFLVGREPDDATRHASERTVLRHRERGASHPPLPPPRWGPGEQLELF